ncbi:MAG: hypothetical protein IKJ93_05275 [Clostridia bacterium]|nr:hypothetical protein [Clostridia bacterium]
MKKFVGNIAIKITAVVLSFILFFTMLVSVAGCVVMLFSDFYTRDFNTLESNIMQKLAEEEMYNLINKYDEGENQLKAYYSDKNILYEIKNEHTGLSLSNFKNQAYVSSYTTTAFVERYVGKSDGMFYGRDQVSYDTEQGMYYHYATNEEVYSTNQKAEFTIYIPYDMQFTDRFFLVDKLINIGFRNRYKFVFTAVLTLVLCIVVYSFLFIAVGHKKDNNKINVAVINNIPADILTVGVLLIFVIGSALFTELDALVTVVSFGSLIASALYFVLLWYLLSVAVQIKAKSLFKHTFLWWFLKQIIKLFYVLKHIYKNLATVYKVVFAIGIVGVLELVFMGLNVYENDNLIVGWIFSSVIIAIVLLLAAIAFQRVKQGGEKIVNGDLDNKIDTTYMFGDIKDFAQSLNNINQGLQSAIDDKMKSERFKTELITNVSHDIKTPLTSIVNYVDLIKKENCDNEKINEYIQVLDRQSNRLKKLTEDLVEMSKASSGNLSVEFTKCNLNLLVSQALGEFSEKLEANSLCVVQSIESEEIYIMADGKRLWRVFDNLLSNICKYAMKGTRVYIDLKKENGKAIVIFRNISDSPINLSQEELTERFVRGDRSRNTEGSGLGLSIAKSLTELQRGVFEISADGDLFKAKLTFDITK